MRRWHGGGQGGATTYRSAQEVVVGEVRNNVDGDGGKSWPPCGEDKTMPAENEEDRGDQRYAAALYLVRVSVG